jgi:arabinan endo-1,5-alpha-L-arabinosidase
MTRPVRYVALLSALAVCAALFPASASPAAPARRPGSYHNPLAPQVLSDGTVDSCADPTVLRGRQGANAHTWYMYCTTDPLNDEETAGTATPTFHSVPTMQSRDLVHWTYVRDALPTRPAWAAATARIWAPDVVYSRTYHRYYLTFTVTDTVDAVSGQPGCSSDSAIGVATSRNPTGPWRVADQPLVPPRRHTAGCDFYWNYDPDVLGDSIGSHSVLYYGSYYGGVFAQRVNLGPDGMQLAGSPTQVTRGQSVRPKVDPVALRQPTLGTAAGRRAAAAAARQATIANRYEGTNVVRRGEWYYLFASATNCCNGPLTGYSVFAGRSRSPLGPFVDREGNSLLAGRVGGTPVISMNGNRWVGTGHNTVFRDFGGQWWTVYHAVDQTHPYFADQPGFTKRPALLDPVDWVGGWPSVRSGRWASSSTMPAPAAQPGQRSAYRPQRVAPDRTGALLAPYSDEFTSDVPGRWTWVRQPTDPTTYGVAGGVFRFHTQAADLSSEQNTASVLTEPAPPGNYVVQTKVRLDLPPEGCCQNYVQAGLVIYGSDDAFIKLVHVSIFETRQTEFAKEVPVGRAGYPRYGNTVVGTPGEVTWLRIVKRTTGGRTLFTAYTSQDARRWVRGGSWVHNGLGPNPRIGLVSMGGAGDFTASFDHVRVWGLQP